MLNPYARIHELERALATAEMARVKAEDESRVMFAKLSAAVESESQSRKDWMALIARLPLFQTGPREPVVHPPPSRRPVLHGAALEKEAYLKFAEETERAERELGIAAID